MFRKTIAILGLLSALMLMSTGLIGSAPAASADDDNKEKSPNGAVFVATNSVDDVRGNEIVMYHQAKDGSLKLQGRFSTNGQGSGPGTRFRGDGLGSGNSIELNKDHSMLFTVNAMSNSVSVFKVHQFGLELTDVVDSNGIFPVSVDVHNNILYVLNSGDDGNISGYEVSRDGKLTPLAGSTRGIDGNQDTVPDALFNPTQVSFTPDGKQLVVTIKDGPASGAIPGVEPTGPGRILVFSVDQNGLPSANAVVTESDNRGPFGFSFDQKGNLLVADFIGGPNLTGAASSYEINEDGTLNPISTAVANNQVDSCWVVNNGRFAYTANFGTNNISSFTVGSDGSLTLLEEEAANTETNGANDIGAFPIDLAVSPDNDFLYLVQPGAGRIGAYQINEDGSLTSLGEVGGLEPTPNIADGDPLIAPFGQGGSPAGIVVASFSDDSLVISGLSVSSDKAYQVAEDLSVGDLVYIDRNYTYTDVPAVINGALYVNTANDDKNRSEPSFMTFSVNQDVTVYVAYDSRATSLPDWLAGWSSTGSSLNNTDVSFNLYAKEFTAEPITLGGNLATGAAGAESNYSVAIVPR